MTWLIILATAVVGVLGAWASVRIRGGAHVAWYWLAGLGPILTWSWMAKRSTWALLLSSVAWDVAYNVAFVATIAVMSTDPVTSRQWVGLLLFLAGLVLVNS